MPDNIRFSSPETLQKPPGYSHVVEVTGPGRTVYFAGQLGIDKSGKMGANACEQMEIAFGNVKAAWVTHFMRRLHELAFGSTRFPVDAFPNRPRRGSEGRQRVRLPPRYRHPPA